MRNIQAAHNATPYACTGSGICCTIGLRLHISECENIANNIRREYWIIAERDGIEVAKEWLQNFINKLVERMYDEAWEYTGVTDKKCAFWDGYCRIYEYRPMVCRAYSLIMPEDGRCPRKKLPDGRVFIYHDDTVKRTIDQYDDTVGAWNEIHDGEDYTVYYAVGILKYLLPQEEMQKLAATTDEKFWTGVPGNSHRFRPESWDAEVFN